MKKIIRTENISYSYPVYDTDDEILEKELSEKALDSVSFEVEKGQFICILGSNGSGKSTLARHLNALLSPNEGTVWIDDMDSREKEYLFEIRSKVGMVFQNPDNQMIASRIDEEVAFGPENLGIPTPEIENKVKNALEKVGLSGYEKENPLYLSGGQKQKTAIAGVLAMEPECIVLDESTSMLDPESRREVMETVCEINRTQKVTIICITHFMDEAVNADRIFVMKNGSIFMQGTPKEIFSREDKVKEAGLMLPVICTLAARLRSLGMDIPEGILTADELRAYIK